MATKKTRINIAVSDDITVLIKNLAKRDSIPVATKARHLIEKALQIEEDDVLDDIACSRDNKKAKYVSHEKAWK